MTNKCGLCKDCKFRLGENGDESEIKQGKFGINVHSNCQKFFMFGNILVDPYILRNTHGTRMSLYDDFGCVLFEPKEKGENEEETTQYRDFSEPEPSPYQLTVNNGAQDACEPPTDVFSKKSMQSRGEPYKKEPIVTGNHEKPVRNEGILEDTEEEIDDIPF